MLAWSYLTIKGIPFTDLSYCIDDELYATIEIEKKGKKYENLIQANFFDLIKDRVLFEHVNNNTIVYVYQACYPESKKAYGGSYIGINVRPKNALFPVHINSLNDLISHVAELDSMIKAIPDTMCTFNMSNGGKAFYCRSSFENRFEKSKMIHMEMPMVECP